MPLCSSGSGRQCPPAITAWCPAPCSLGLSSSRPGHPLLFTALSIIIYLLTDPDPSEFGKVETNNRNQLTLAKIVQLVQKKVVLAGKNVLNRDLLGFVLPNPAMKALLHLNWQGDRK